MTVKPKTKFIHQGKYVAEVDVKLIVNADEWSAYLSLEDAYQLDDIRDALKKGDLRKAATMARVFELHPVAV